jgi:hypothetical protein
MRPRAITFKAWTLSVDFISGYMPHYDEKRLEVLIAALVVAGEHAMLFYSTHYILCVVALELMDIVEQLLCMCENHSCILLVLCDNPDSAIIRQISEPAFPRLPHTSWAQSYDAVSESHCLPSLFPTQRCVLRPIIQPSALPHSLT